MTYLELVNTIKNILGLQLNVHTVTDTFTDLNREDTKYSAMVLQTREHQRNGDFMTYNFWLGYVDRLVDGDYNELEIQSTGIQILNNVINILSQKVDNAGVSGGTFVPFNQRFLARTAGVYCNLSITVPVENCVYGIGPDFNEDFSDDFRN